jgi:hypothetical protein
MKRQSPLVPFLRAVATGVALSALFVAGCAASSDPSPSAGSEPTAQLSPEDRAVVDEMSATPEATTRIATTSALGWTVAAWSTAQVERRGTDSAAILRMVRNNTDNKGEGSADLIFTKGTDGKVVILSRAIDEASNALLKGDLQERAPGMHAVAEGTGVHTQDWWQSGGYSYAYYTAAHYEFWWCQSDVNANFQGWATLWVYEGGGAQQAWGPHYNTCGHVQTEPYPIYWEEAWWACNWDNVCG